MGLLNNKSLVLKEVGRGRDTYTSIMKSTGLGYTSISLICSELKKNGLIVKKLINPASKRRTKKNALLLTKKGKKVLTLITRIEEYIE